MKERESGSRAKDEGTWKSTRDLFDLAQMTSQRKKNVWHFRQRAEEKDRKKPFIAND